MMAMSLSGVSAAPPVAYRGAGCGGSSRVGLGSLRFAAAAAPCHPLLHSSFVPVSAPFSSSFFSGLSLGISFMPSVITPGNRRGIQVRAGKKYRLCQTKRNRSRKSLARVHGFRRRMRTTSGRALLKRRRAKGRRVLCPKSYPRTGKGA